MHRIGSIVLGVGIAMALAGSTAGAQAFRVGVVGGVNHGTVTGGSGAGLSGHQWLLVGASATARLTPFFSIRAEGLFSRKGAAQEQSMGMCGPFESIACGCPVEMLCLTTVPTITPIRNIAELGYLEFPLLARLELPSLERRTIRPFVVAGPSVAIRVGCQLRSTTNGTTVSSPCEDQYARGSRFNDSDFGMVLGGGVSVGDFDVGARWTRGLSSVTTASTFAAPFDLTGSRTSTLSFTVDYRIRLR